MSKKIELRIEEVIGGFEVRAFFPNGNMAASGTHKKLIDAFFALQATYMLVKEVMRSTAGLAELPKCKGCGDDEKLWHKNLDGRFARVCYECGNTEYFDGKEVSP